MKSVETRQAELEARRAQLMTRMEQVESELDSHVEKDWDDAAVEQEQDEVLEDLGESAQQELRAIEAALGRIAEGEYGFCVTCGERIDEARLDVLPATPFCRKHAPGAKTGRG
ncbi:MAG: TraR/DksA family transcriptional regulator [Thioclava marina]|uniref:Dimethylmenaquinone methyltransferase n=1 Tax=Thioclava marina TaxID=1915077 RepID=A0ABX3MRN1_9RHOB|nr:MULTISPECIES: TraR/DksA C4-type zinc finger protein [Thioclava]TNE88669.1 MAG: TraR/DksA family transcriptional regulator [Paracoccaceae bacterium]MBC7146549.1 TraR/DksA family transcriptional regulator [Thioclava marina]MBD3804803.1 TraR/DksA family transcriptional regulator [Thioclava sp.]OOY14188.1 dimethylmenaquinone methyltransferase [Thioclava marina]OOY29801.1 dimethylmenaquinone methyltransferase [Thioclava sp. L04-15]